VVAECPINANQAVLNTSPVIAAAVILKLRCAQHKLRSCISLMDRSHAQGTCTAWLLMMVRWWQPVSVPIERVVP